MLLVDVHDDDGGPTDEYKLLLEAGKVPTLAFPVSIVKVVSPTLFV